MAALRVRFLLLSSHRFRRCYRPRREPYLARFHHSFAPIFGNFPDPISSRSRPVYILLFRPVFASKKVIFHDRPPKRRQASFLIFVLFVWFSTTSLNAHLAIVACRPSNFSIYIYFWIIFTLYFAGGFLVWFARFPTPFHSIFLYTAIATIFISNEVAVGVLEH